jgi:hypothetical protein
MRSLSNTTSSHRVAYAPQPPEILKVIIRKYMRAGHTIYCVMLLASIRSTGRRVRTSIRDDIPSAPGRHGAMVGVFRGGRREGILLGLRKTFHERLFTSLKFHSDCV